jgi:hypothetical protein
MQFLRCLPLALVAAGLTSSGTLRASPPVELSPDLLIGYTEFRTDLPCGRYVNVWTMRAVVIKADGTDRRVLAEELTREKGYWAQFYGWSPDGKTAILLRGWESEENGKRAGNLQLRRTGRKKRIALQPSTKEPMCVPTSGCSS